jgi:hypothetical protein
MMLVHVILIIFVTDAFHRQWGAHSVVPIATNIWTPFSWTVSITKVAGRWEKLCIDMISLWELKVIIQPFYTNVLGAI